MNVRVIRLSLAAAVVIAALVFYTHRSQPKALAPVQAQAPASQSQAQQAPVKPPQAPQAQAEQRQAEQPAAGDEDTDSSDVGTFHGYACTVDCSGHEAGYNWAEERGITDKDDCPIDPHNSHSFTEGCWAYADEQSGHDGGSP